MFLLISASQVAGITVVSHGTGQNTFLKSPDWQKWKEQLGII
jgi:hypothetical protein